MSQRVTIERAAEPNAAAIAAFNIAMAQETEGKTLEPAVVAAGVRALMAQPHYGFYVVARQAEQAIGSLLITFEWSDWRNGLIWWIQSVYVDPAYRRQGIFRQLYAQVRAWSQEETGVCGVRLYVEEANHNAQETYKALGMKPAGYLVFEDLD